MDADIEMNADLYRFAVDGDQPTTLNKPDAEIGHLGLDHRPTPRP